ncbi:unnamed protein product [Dibothriocephalus latus]|uniref:ER membrane protein complex subunit 4 n=1 Tax=Dibothriocephalus latus TaxID=60516 RepID=A0A3P6QF83_DIBLA|nr:unnamed protein product [Dibothriocephalus latus]
MDTFDKASYSLTEYASLSSLHFETSHSIFNFMPSQPVGYVERTFPITAARDQDDTLTVKRSWDIALAPLRQIPMNLLIMWMTGNSISIFPIMMVIMMFMRPIQAILSMQATFKLIEGSQAPIQCFAYLFGNLVMLALAVYKCHNMGLLPTYASDWLSFVEPAQVIRLGTLNFI